MKNPLSAVLPPAASLALLLFAGASFARDINHHFHERYDVTEGMRLILVHEDGDVEIRPGEEDVLEVDVVYRRDVKRIGVGKDPEFEVEVTRDGDTIRIAGRESGHAGMNVVTISHIQEYRYTIRAPAWLDLDLRGDDGDVSIAGWRGRLGARGEDGDVNLEGCETVAHIDLDDGDLDLSGCSGDFDIRVEDGDVHLRNHVAERLRIRTDDGDVTADLRGADDMDTEIQVEDGSVTLRLPGDLPVECLVRTEDGRFRADLPTARRVEIRDQAGYVELAGTKGKIRITTDDGDIELRER
jgi:hypothetical protein